MDDLSELKRKVEANSRTFIPNRDIILSLIARVEKLEEALKPFAALHDEILECCKLYTAPDNDPDNWSKACTWADLRAAACVHAELAEKEKE